MKPHRELEPLVEIRDFARSKLQEIDQEINNLREEWLRSEEKIKECPCIESEIAMKFSYLQEQRVAVELIIDEINKISSRYAKYLDQKYKPKF